MAKTQFNKIQLQFVSKIHYEMITNMFTGHAKNTPVPEGEQHIFQVTKDGSLEARSFCGKAVADIGEQTEAHKDRVTSLPLCKACEAKWKKHPQSPWQMWAKGQKVS